MIIVYVAASVVVRTEILLFSIGLIVVDEIAEAIFNDELGTNVVTDRQPTIMIVTMYRDTKDGFIVNLQPLN